ncbi:MAG: hypothetical protein UY56_C0025G0006 [Parcubacteria group bacterium GW2011_GWA1_50_14]|uniref:Type 4 fimbrial biogenesis protein PilX N-terminal domain-containing protein n=1 Tax=Candidatus Liptonbacteria bacterium GWB1_49_6 TaxID=1798644 RepID=A0A1G2C5E9_9BACT|nr:MAG: hypothetical protein UY56_C0025G0006 [Parcubacteria group bacterium GW2011_GWA1_50_14]OGY96633.1 MAG: hypothetical protein A2122_00340 [Candidatus Liptonbacteria bacterium GWB1_49_6]
MRIKNERGGYVAITAAILIVAMFTIVMFVIGTSSFLSRDNISDTHFKEKSIALAEGCFQVALFRIAEDPTYAGGETVPIDSDACRIISVVASGTSKIITVSSTFQAVHSNFRLTIQQGNFSFINWEELPNF